MQIGRRIVEEMSLCLTKFNSTYLQNDAYLCLRVVFPGQHHLLFGEFCVNSTTVWSFAQYDFPSKTRETKLFSTSF